MGASIISVIGGIGKQVLRGWPMSRAGLSLPRQFDRVTELTVQARDINCGVMPPVAAGKTVVRTLLVRDCRASNVAPVFTGVTAPEMTSLTGSAFP